MISQEFQWCSWRESTVADLVRRLIRSQPQLDYQELNLNLVADVQFAPNLHAATEYLNRTLLAAGAWQTIAGVAPEAQVKLCYPFPDGKLNLKISNTTIQQAGVEIPMVSFLGNFQCGCPKAESQRLSWFDRQAAGWEARVERYLALLNDHFLPPTPSKRKR